MKKRIIIASILLFLAVGLCVLSYFTTDLISKNIIKSIDNIEEAIILSEMEFATDETMKMTEKWQAYHNILSIYIRNNLTENANASINALNKYLIINEQNAALLVCQDIRASIETILESEKFNFNNIL